MTDRPTISVIIPCYNAERYVVAAIQSVIDQQWPGLDIIMVDDGSPDRSVEQVRLAFPQVTLLTQHNQGVAVARNAGLAAAKGDWIAFLDADDIWLPGKLQAQWQAMTAQPRTRMSYTAWDVWCSSDPLPAVEYLEALRLKAADARRWSGPTGWLYPELLLDCAVWTSTVVAHRSLLEETGPFDAGLRIGEDYDLWLRASRVTPILRIDHPYALYRMHPASITRTAPKENYRGLVIQRAIDRWGYRSPDGRVARSTEVARSLASSWSEFAAANLQAGDAGRARKAALQAVRVDPFHLTGWKALVRSVFASSAPVTR